MLNRLINALAIFFTSREFFVTVITMLLVVAVGSTVMGIIGLFV